MITSLLEKKIIQWVRHLTIDLNVWVRLMKVSSILLCKVRFSWQGKIVMTVMTILSPVLPHLYKNTSIILRPWEVSTKPYKYLEKVDGSISKESDNINITFRGVETRC